MKLLTLNPDLATLLEVLGCTREAFPVPGPLLVVDGPPEILLDRRRPRRPGRS